MPPLVETLDELQEMVVPLFVNVENKKIDVPEWPESPYGEKQLKVSEALLFATNV